jgi:Sigma-70 region 2
VADQPAVDLGGFVGGVVVEDEVHLVLGGDLAVELVDCADGVVRRCAPAPQLTLSRAAHSGRPTSELQIHCYRLGSVQDAEDLLQQTLLAAWRGIGGDEERASVRTWLYRIAANRCLNPLLYRDEGDDERVVGWNRARRAHKPMPIDDDRLLNVIELLAELEAEAMHKLFWDE